MTVGSQYAITNSSGNYTLWNIPAVNQWVTISCLSYRYQVRAVEVPPELDCNWNFTLVPSSTTTTWYIATTGNNQSGDGSASYPYATIDYADQLGVLAPGDIVHVNPGTYYVNTNSIGVHITSASNGVTYQADSAESRSNRSTTIPDKALWCKSMAV